MNITGITKYMGRGRRTDQESRTPLLPDAQIRSEQAPLEPNNTSSAKSSLLSRIPAFALGILAHNTQNQNHIAQAGAIPALVTLLNSGTDKGKAYAAFALGNLAANNTQNQNAIAQADAIPALVTLLNSGTDKGKAYAAAALGNLANNTQNQNDIANTPGVFQDLVTLLNSRTDKGKAYAAAALGNLAANNTQIQTAITQEDAIPALVTLLKSGTDKGKVYAAAALDNLANNNTQNQNAIAQADAIPALATLLIYGTRMQKEHAANALGTLAHNTQNQGSIQALGFLVYGRDRANSFADMALNNPKFYNTQNQTGTADVSLLLAHLLFDQTTKGYHLRENFYQDNLQAKLRDECSKLDPNILLFDQITIGKFLNTGRLIQRI